MDLRELRIGRLPGLTRSFTVVAEPGFNLILGPNGSGKSSLCRAALGLLWPPTAPAGELSATWHEGDTVWHASRAGGTVVAWQRDGQPSEPPMVPALAQASAFRLGLLDLLKLEADATDQDLARAIRNQMAGGYDLSAMLDQEAVSGLEGKKAAADLAAAEQRVAALRLLRTELADQEASLQRLRHDLEQARRAAGRQEALRIALAVVQARTEAEDAAQHLAQRYPAVMANLAEDAAQRLQILRDRHQNAAKEAEQARRDVATAEAIIADTDLPDGGPDPIILTTARRRLDEARQLATRHTTATENLAAAAATERSAREQLAPWGEPAPDDDVDEARLREIATGLHDQLRYDAERQTLDRLLADDGLQPPDPPLPAPESLAAARAGLVAWLQATPERTLPWLPMVVGLVLVAVGAWRYPDPVWLVPGLGLAVLAAALVPFVWRPRSRQARAAFVASGLPAPIAWSRAAVETRLAALDDDLIAAHHQTLLETLRRQLRQRRDRAADDLAALAPAHDEPAAALSAVEWLHRSAHYHRARREHAAAEARVTQLAAELTQRLEAAAADLAPWLRSPADDLTALATGIEDLQQRSQRRQDATRDHAAAARRQADKADVAAVAAAEIAELLTAQELGPEDDAVLRARVAQLATYRQRQATAAGKATELELRQRALDALPADLQEIAQNASRRPAAELAVDLAAVETEAAAAETLQQSITTIETRLDQARHDSALDAALTERDTRAASLAQERDRVRSTHLRRLLLERLRRQHRRLSEPPVLARARDLFLDFTTSRFELTIPDDDQESFRARDTRTGEGLALGQLSDGTRAQLLLAARLAFLREAERGVRIPLFLDESLTASDPARFDAVGRAVLRQVAEEDRQVFYLTCDPADIRAWQDLLAATGLPPAPVIDLAALRHQHAAAPASRLEPRPRSEVPGPRPDETPAAYARRLQVPALDGHAPASAAHLFHLLRDDLPLLHGLLAHGVVALGQVEPLAAVLAAEGVLPAPAWSRLQVRGRALSRFLDRFAIGRGRPVPAGAIARESGISSSKLDEVEDVLAREDHDAARLLAALAAREVARFNQEKQGELAGWLREEGYLDERDPLPLAEIRSQVLGAAESDLASGLVTLAELEDLLAAWWAAAGG